jgi:hypothetical protein
MTATLNKGTKEFNILQLYLYSIQLKQILFHFINSYMAPEIRELLECFEMRKNLFDMDSFSGF